MKNNKLIEVVRQRLTEYLVSHGQRRTSERYLILEKIYETEGHFDIDTLYNRINEKESIVSRATLYNSMNVLVDSGLVIRHQFGNNVAIYEKSYNVDNHHHLVCTNCGKVMEMRDEKIKNVIKEKSFPGFQMSNYSLYIFGHCQECEEKLQQTTTVNPFQSTI